MNSTFPLAALPVLIVSVMAQNSLMGQCQLSNICNGVAYQDLCGQAVALTGRTVVVAIPGDWYSGQRVGVARVFEYRDGMLRDRAALRASDGAVGTGFGASAAISADERLIAIGASTETHEQVIDGSVYLFELGASGAWEAAGVLVSTQLDTNDPLFEFFGRAVAIDGGRVVVGAPNDRAAYLFEQRSDAKWVQQARLVPSSGGAQFGSAIAIRENVIAVGAPDHSTGGGVIPGCAFVFEQNDEGNWFQTAQLMATDPSSLAKFGTSIGMCSDTILVGSSSDHAGIVRAGSVYAFMRNSVGQWVQTQKITLPSPVVGDHFGGSIAIDGNTAVVGAIGRDDAGLTTGAAFVYSPNGANVWELQGVVFAELPDGISHFGHSVGISGLLAVVGAPRHDQGNQDDVGAAYLFAVSRDADGDGQMDICACRERGDFDVDGVVGIYDLLILLSSFGVDERGDLDGDADCDLSDLTRFLAEFGAVCL